MNIRDKGIVFVLIGIIFLTLSIVLPSPTIFWGISLGISIISNIIGTGMLLKFLKEKAN